MYSVKYHKQASKFLKRLAVKGDIKRIYSKVENLKVEPFPKDAKRVEGYNDFKVFRIRVGSYRILYFINFKEQKIYVVSIDKRERVY